MTTEWIEHDGQDAPDLPLDTLVQVTLRGDIPDDDDDFIASIGWWHEGGASSWVHLGDKDDITHYRVVTK